MLRQIAGGGALVIALVACGVARAETPTARNAPTASNKVQVSLADLHRFVGDGDNGRRWKQFLKSDELAAELAKGAAADRGVLAGALAKYSGPEAGLDLPRFVAVKTALARLIGELPQPEQPGNLAAAARAAKANFAPIHAAEVTKAKVELATAIRDLEAWLHRSGASNATAWKKYLGWSALENIVAQDGPPPADSVARLISKLTANEIGLEMRHFLRTREALQNYAYLATAGADARLQQQTGQQLEKLAAAIEAYNQNQASGDDALAIGRTLGWLGRSRQSTALAIAIRRQYSQPNLHASVSKRFAAVGLEQEIDQTTGVRENILGTDLHGTARLTGRTTVSLIDTPEAATLNILLGGTAVSSNIGYNGPVTVHTSGVTSISGSKQLQMTASGLVGQGATAHCSTNSTIHSIDANCGLIEKMAWKRAGKQKAEAQAIASGRAAGRVASQMDAQAAELIAEQNQRYGERFKKPLLRRGAFPTDLTFSSTADRAFVRMLDAGPGRLAAPAPPPEHEGTHDIALRVHESLAINLGESTLGGVELTDLRLEKLIKEDLKTELPEELRVTLADGTLDPDKEPWSIIFAKELPVRAKFQDGGLWLAIRAEGFTRGEGDTPGTYKPVLSELVEISAAYKIERTDVGATLRRDGDVKVRFPDRANPDQVTVRDNATVTFMRRKFRNLFKEEFAGQGIKLKDRWEKAGTLKLAEIKSTGAWLTLGWQMPTAEAAAGE